LVIKHKETENKLKVKSVSELELRNKLESIRSRRNSPKKKASLDQQLNNKLTEVQKQKNILNPLAENFVPETNIRECSPIDQYQNQDKKGISPNTAIKTNPNLSAVLKKSINMS
jgi:hypothetical protein